MFFMAFFPLIKRAVKFRWHAKGQKYFTPCFHCLVAPKTNAIWYFYMRRYKLHRQIKPRTLKNHYPATSLNMYNTSHETSRISRPGWNDWIALAGTGHVASLSAVHRQTRAENHRHPKFSGERWRSQSVLRQGLDRRRNIRLR